MNTQIISAFPCTGKSYLFKNSKKYILDSDSSEFSWLESEVKRHPNFPNNYIEHIKNNIDKVDIILVSSHKVVRDALVDNKIKFILIYPNENAKIEYLNRCKKRGSPDSFIKMLNDNWYIYLNEMKQQTCCNHIEMKYNEFLCDYFK